MLSISAFKAFPEIPDLASSNGLKLEYVGLVDKINYPIDFLQSEKENKYSSLYNSAHGPFYDLIPPSSDFEVSDVAKAKFIRAIDACKYLGIQNIIFHNGWIHAFYDNNQWIDNSIKFWNSIVEYANGSVVIHLENVMENEPFLIKEIITGINSPFFKACLDVGHVNVFSKIGIINWIKEIGISINHVHLHNNYGVEDSHNGLSNGNINIGEVFKRIRDICGNIAVNLELRNDIEKSIEIINELEKEMA